MRKIVLISLCLMIFEVSFLSSCEEPPVKKEMWAVMVNFLSPDTSYYPAFKEFPYPGSLQFAPMDSFFVNQGKLPLITDSSIVFYDNYRVNGKKMCCEKDTLQVFIDTINSKKYLFAIGDYIALFQSDSNGFAHLNKRKEMAPLPLWGITLNRPYPPENFLFDHEKLSASHVKLRQEFDEVTKQKWVANDSILIESIQFNNSPDLVITSVYRDISKDEADSMINYIKSNFQSAKFKENRQKDFEGKWYNTIQADIDGVSMTFTQTSENEYSFQATDYYETLRLILKTRQRYTFRDDVSIY